MVILLENIGKENKREIKESYKLAIATVINGHNSLIKNIINKVQSGIVE